MVAQTTEGTGLAPAGVIDTKPLTGETLPGDEFADRPQAAASAHTAAAMIIHRRGHLFTCASPPHVRLRISITNWPPPLRPVLSQMWRPVITRRPISPAATATLICRISAV